MAGQGLGRSSYYDSKYRQAPALIRARRPYLVKNAIFGVALAGFTLGVYGWTISKMGQDDFSDVKVPDVPATQAQGSPAKDP